MNKMPLRYQPDTWTPIQSPMPHAVEMMPLGSRLVAQLPGDSQPGDGVRVVVGGDWAAVREFAAADKADRQALYGELHPSITSADLSIVNLECPLGGDTPILKDGPSFRCDPRCAAALVEAGFHVATLANNHIYDQGAAGLTATLNVCRDAGLMTVGAGDDLSSAMRPVFLKVQGMRIGILALSEVSTIDGQHGGAAPIFDVHVLDRCRQARRNCDQLLVIVHGGKEYSPYPPPYWYEQVLAVAGAGADAVIGHHPHVPQGLTWARREGGPPVPVVFSTGNFVFPPRPATAVMSAWMSLGYLVELRLSEVGVIGLHLLPYQIVLPEGMKPLNEEQTVRFAAWLQTLSDPLSDRAQIESWFDDCCDYFWQQEWFNRVEGLTAKLCRDDMAGLKHGRSHFETRAHATLIDRVIARKLAGTYGNTTPDRRKMLEQWFRGEWPCPVTGC